ncbi:CMRF35-like molecule 8 [Rhynchocyon petersi]
MCSEEVSTCGFPVAGFTGIVGCVTLTGPQVVTGTEGGSLSVQCQYAEKYKDNDKYWCREPSVRPCNKIVRTSKSEREKQRGRVSLRDDPAQLNFTVTMTHLTAEDKGVYWCGIFVTLISDQKLLDPTFPVVIAVFPDLGKKTASPAYTILCLPCRLHVLLSVVAILLLLLLGTSLVAWRLARRRRAKAAENPEPSQNPSQPQMQPVQSTEPCYANLELRRLPSGRAGNQQQDVAVEYSTVVSMAEVEVQYSPVTQVPVVGAQALHEGRVVFPWALAVNTLLTSMSLSSL